MFVGLMFCDLHVSRNINNRSSGVYKFDETILYGSKYLTI